MYTGCTCGCWDECSHMGLGTVQFLRGTRRTDGRRWSSANVARRTCHSCRIRTWHMNSNGLQSLCDTCATTLSHEVSLLVAVHRDGFQTRCHLLHAREDELFLVLSFSIGEFTFSESEASIADAKLLPELVESQRSVLHLPSWSPQSPCPRWSYRWCELLAHVH